MSEASSTPPPLFDAAAAAAELPKADQPPPPTEELEASENNGGEQSDQDQDQDQDQGEGSSDHVKRDSYSSGGHPVEFRANVGGGGRFCHATTGAELLDADGHSFDLLLHERDPGTSEVRPSLTTKGLIRRKRGSRGFAAGAEPELERVADPIASQSIPPPRYVAPEPELELAAERIVGSEINDIAADAFAKVLVGTLGQMAASSLGDWAKQESDEKSEQVAAWSAYLRTLDMTTPPPWSIPLLVSVPWFARLMSDPRAPFSKRFTEKEPKSAETPGDAPPPVKEFGFDDEDNPANQDLDS